MITTTHHHIGHDTVSPHKYGSDPMAEYLHHNLTSGSWTPEDDHTTEHLHTTSAARWGRRILWEDDQGFVWVTKYDTEDDAMAGFEQYRREADHSERYSDLIGASPYRLATIADVSSPDGPDSPGADFLCRILLDIREVFISQDFGSTMLYDEDVDADDYCHQLADTCVPVYTWDLWQTFTDLAAWQEDEVNELVEPDADMETRARVALYNIAYRLATTLLEDGINL